jgi:hypothetical protein
VEVVCDGCLDLAAPVNVIGRGHCRRGEWGVGNAKEENRVLHTRDVQRRASMPPSMSYAWMLFKAPCHA